MRTMTRGKPTAMDAGQGNSMHMSFSMPEKQMGMCMCAATATASKIIIGTGVLTSVSLFVLRSGSLLLVGLVAIISLILTGLAGLNGLESLVGPVKELATMTARGD